MVWEYTVVTTVDEIVVVHGAVEGVSNLRSWISFRFWERTVVRRLRSSRNTSGFLACHGSEACSAILRQHLASKDRYKSANAVEVDHDGDW